MAGHLLERLPFDLLRDFPRRWVEVLAVWVDPQRVHRVLQRFGAMPLNQALPVRGVLIDRFRPVLVRPSPLHLAAQNR